MERITYLGRPSAKQLVASEVARFLAPRQQKLTRLILDDELLVEEKAQLTTIQSELAALETIVADELHNIDQKISSTTTAIANAKKLG